MTDTRKLLEAYGETGSEAAFGEIVARYFGLVYSTALRVVGGDAHLAEDVAQTVFIGLARKARALSAEVLLGGWLHRHTFHVATKALRAERRRQTRERQALEMNRLDADATDAAWRHLAPALDQAIARLGHADRTAILLRFFERQDLRAVGAALGGSEDAARMRVNRALEKLRGLLARRGVSLSAAALASALASEALTAAPAGLAAGVAATALAGSTAGVGIAATALQIMAMTKLHTGILGALLIGAATTLVIERQHHLALDAEARSLRGQVAQLQTDRQRLSERLAQASPPPPPPPAPALASQRLRELLRLRGEVTVLRRQLRDLEQAASAGRSPAADAAAPPARAATPPASPAPFQVQLVADGPGEDTEPANDDAGPGGTRTLHLHRTPLLDQAAIQTASVSLDPGSGAPAIDVQFSDVGKELFAQVTRENLNKRLAIVLDGRLYQAPVIRSAITGGKAQITGVFTEDEARALAAKINQAIGAAPTPARGD